MRRVSCIAAIVASTLLAAGCGGDDTVRYVDPNPDSAYLGAGGGGTSQPFLRSGADVAARARAIVHLRSRLATARALRATDPAAAARQLNTAVDVDLLLVEPWLELDAPALRRRVRSALERLRDASTTLPMATYSAGVDRTAGALLDAVAAAVVPTRDSQDAGFRAAVLATSIEDAALEFEQAGTDEEHVDADEYSFAWGLLLDARTRGIDAATAPDRELVRRRLTTVADRDLTTPDAPDSLGRTQDTVDALTNIVDLVTSSAGVDTQLPSPGAEVPDQLRALKRIIAAALETWERGEVVAARRQLRTNAVTALQVAAPGLAATDPERLGRVADAVIIDLPATMTSGGDAESVAATLDTEIDDAVTTVQQELEAAGGAASSS